LLALGAGMLSASAETITGRPSIIDGDTIEISGERIRLHGIDAPESKQTCQRDGKTWACGKDATFALAAMIERHWVECVGRDRDRYGRIIAICTMGGPNGVNLNQQMVADGWAMAYREYSMDYVNAENAASASKRNLWQSEFHPPWEWRREQRAEAPAPKRQHGPQPECVIKGNISRSGERIYHVPGGQDYDRTQITESAGERWFCSEAEALAAGWRRSKR
jgi:endonuclease YncB( thermonuclease family)